MVKYLAILSSVLLLSCTKQADQEDLLISAGADSLLVEIPDITIENSLLQFDPKTSQWKLNDQLYSGYTVSYYQDSVLKEKIGFYDGRKQNRAFQWYPDEHLKRIADYHKGKLHGTKKSWSVDSNHILVTQLNYHMGKAHGEQKFWYSTGELYKVLKLNMGKEEGIQQAFRKNGALYANYEVKDGRIFGLKKATLCYGLEGENIKYEN